MNVIKWRQLPNGEHITPKSDFIYGYETNGEQRIYNIDGTIKQDTLNSVWNDIDGGTYYSVGKGQVMSMDGKFNYDEAGNDEYRLVLTDKKEGYIKYFVIKTGTTDHLDVINYKFFTFLGQPFKASGDNDRYAVICYLNSDTRFAMALLNIDTWTLGADLTTSGIVNDSFDDSFIDNFTYDGVEWIYYNYRNGNRLTKYNIITNENVAVNDSTGTRITTDKIYGINDNFLFYKNPNGKVWRYTIASGEAKEWNFAGDHTNMIQLPENKYFLQGSSSEATFQFVYNSGDGAHIDIFQSLVNGGSIIGEDELGLTPALITNCVNTSEYIEFDWVLFRNGYSGNSLYSTKGVRTRLNKNGSSSVADWTPSSTLLGTGYGITISTFNQDTINNSFSNSCNSYGVGKFYDYGLQKQWENR